MGQINICLVYPGFYPDDFAGGIGTILGEYLKMFSEKKEKIILLSRTLDLKKSIIIDKNIEIHRMPTDVNRFIKILNFITRNRFRMLFYSISIYIYLKKISKNKKIDIIEGCDWGAELYYTAKHRLKIPILVRIHTPSFISEKYNPSNKSYLGSYTKKIEKKLLNNSNIIVITPENSIINEFKNENVMPHKIIYNACYPLSEVKLKGEKKNKYCNIMFAGRIEERKGVETIFYLMKRILLDKKIKDIKFYFFGADTTLKNGMKYRKILLKKYRLEKFVESNIFFCGFLQREKLLEKMKEMDIYISASKYELVGYSALESIKNGNILIHSGTGLLRKFIRNNREGFTFKNKEELVTMVLKIIDNDVNNIEQIRQCAIKRVNKYTNSNYLYNKTMTLYKNILKVDL